MYSFSYSQFTDSNRWFLRNIRTTYKVAITRIMRIPREFLCGWTDFFAPGTRLYSRCNGRLAGSIMVGISVVALQMTNSFLRRVHRRKHVSNRVNLMRATFAAVSRTFTRTHTPATLLAFRVNALLRKLPAKAGTCFLIICSGYIFSWSARVCESVLSTVYRDL